MPTLSHSPPFALLEKARNTATILLLLFCPVLNAAELLYVFEPQCGACRAFDRDIGSIYPKTEEASIAPLRPLNFSEIHGNIIVLEDQQVQLKAAIVGTPTFILISDGHEVDRFSGYSRDELFWMSLQRLLNRLPRPQ
ncbi:thioredoxin family protein [Microbulbifer pacificus]|uniref:Thioredoxin family protein n=1 Tax=Microbulbifer pacificus TaxID=407164 RepID=A0AAU0MXX9_9GAMM|nr:thioredoxin family protein [Microbulbifer pacificus]WOX04737.1 thioredoxin family protein [Microbulbifer pacificus]